MTAATATNPDLEAVIEKSPDEADGYFVYGDWLESEGDPRGELIALQSALLRKPRDKTLTRAIDQHLEKHREHLLGADLAKLTADELVLEWRLGFIYSARLHVKHAEAKSTLVSLINHPSGRFIQCLTIARIYGVPVMKASECVDLLLDAKKPSTLKELRIGSLTDWDVDKDSAAAELKKTFPRLQRSINVVWQSIMTMIGEQPRRANRRFDPSKLPVLVPIEGVDLGSEPIDNERVLMGLKMEIDNDREVGLVVAMRRAFTPASLDQFAVNLGEQFADAGEPTSMKWGFLAMGLLGQDEAASWIAERLRRWSHQRAVQGAQMLGGIGSAVAIYELYGMVSDPSVNRPRRVDGLSVVEKTARQRSLSIESLLDRSVPTTASPTFPQVIERARETTMRRFLRDMIDGRRISLHEFRHYIVQHPTVGPLAQRLVWASFDKRNVVATFRVRGEDGAAVDANGALVVHGSEAIGIVHPAEIEERERADTVRRWKKAFETAQIAPLFLQLDRPVFTLREQEKTDTITRFKLRGSPGFDRMRAVLEQQRDWHVSSTHDQGGVETWGREMPRDNVFVSALLGDGIEGVTVSKIGGGKITFRSLHPVTVSEILYDVDTATMRESADPATAAGAAAAAAAAEAAAVAARGVKKGSRVRIGLRGESGRGKWGVVFWIGERVGVLRCGVRDDDDETHWVDIQHLEKVSEDEIAASLKEKKKTAAKETSKKVAKMANVATTESDKEEKNSRVSVNKEAETPTSALKKGMRVSWKSGKNVGTGTVFWLGPGKFGGGPRAGVKDAETGETVWAAAADCEPIPDPK